MSEWEGDVGRQQASVCALLCGGRGWLQHCFFAPLSCCASWSNSLPLSTGLGLLFHLSAGALLAMGASAKQSRAGQSRAGCCLGCSTGRQEEARGNTAR